MTPFWKKRKRCPDVEEDRFPSDNPINQRASERRERHLCGNSTLSRVERHRFSMLVKGQKTTVLARSRSQISLTHVKNYFGAVNSAFFWFTASSGIEGVIYLGGGDRDSLRARTQHRFTERCTRISHDLFSISTFFLPQNLNNNNSSFCGLNTLS